MATQRVITMISICVRRALIAAFFRPAWNSVCSKLSANVFSASDAHRTLHIASVSFFFNIAHARLPTGVRRALFSIICFLWSLSERSDGVFRRSFIYNCFVVFEKHPFVHTPALAFEMRTSQKVFSVRAARPHSTNGPRYHTIQIKGEIHFYDVIIINVNYI